MDKSFLDSSNIFLMTNMFCNIFCKNYVFEMDEVRTEEIEEMIF